MTLSKKALGIKPSSTLEITAEAKRLRAEGNDIVGFTAGEPDFDTPGHIKQAAIKAINDGITKYTPTPGLMELRNAICKKLKKENDLSYEPTQIVVSNGAKHSLVNALMAITNKGDEIIIPAPFWVSYADMVQIADGVPKIVQTKEEENFKLTKALLEANINEKTKAIMLNSPSNPTGMVYTLEELKVIADIAVKNDLFVISDEIYENLIYDDHCKHISIATLNEEIYKRTIVINGMSKSFAMTGWRIGYLATTKEIAKVIGNLQAHMTSNPNSIAQMAAIAGLESDSDCVKIMREQFKIRRDYIYKRVSKMSNVRTLKPQGAFYLFVNIDGLLNKEVQGKILKTAKDVAEILIKKYGVAVIPCEDFYASNYLRLSYAISMENIEKGLDRIENFIKENY